MNTRAERLEHYGATHPMECSTFLPARFRPLYEAEQRRRTRELFYWLDEGGCPPQWLGTTVGQALKAQGLLSSAVIHPSAQIGDDGFGYEWDGHRWQPRPHEYGVKLGEDVAVGANTTIHRGRWRNTAIGDGTKIDSNVFVAHNVVVGRHCLLVAGCCLAGSVTLGDEVIVGLGALVNPGVKIGERAIIGAGAVVTKDVPAGEVWAGSPARYMRDRKPGETL